MSHLAMVVGGRVHSIFVICFILLAVITCSDAVLTFEKDHNFGQLGGSITIQVNFDQGDVASPRIWKKGFETISTGSRHDIVIDTTSLFSNLTISALGTSDFGTFTFTMGSNVSPPIYVSRYFPPILTPSVPDSENGKFVCDMDRDIAGSLVYQVKLTLTWSGATTGNLDERSVNRVLPFDDISAVCECKLSAIYNNIEYEVTTTPGEVTTPDVLYVVLEVDDTISLNPGQPFLGATYKWFRNSTLLSSEVAQNYNSASNEDGIYRRVAFKDTPASMYIFKADVYVFDIELNDVLVGEFNEDFVISSVILSPSGPHSPTYQWTFVQSGTSPPDPPVIGTGFTYTVKSAQANDAGTYSLKASLTRGETTVRTQSVEFEVLQATITPVAADQYFVENSLSPFECLLIPTDATEKWYMDGELDTTFPTDRLLTLADDKTNIYCEGSKSGKTSQSNNVLVNVYAPLEFDSPSTFYGVYNEYAELSCALRPTKTPYTLTLYSVDPLKQIAIGMNSKNITMTAAPEVTTENTDYLCGAVINAPGLSNEIFWNITVRVFHKIDSAAVEIAHGFANDLVLEVPKFLKCIVIPWNATAPIKFSWKRNGVSFGGDTTPKSENEVSFTLSNDEFTTKEDVSFICSASNSLDTLSSSESSDITFLDVKPFISTSPVSTNAIENSDVTFTCEAKGHTQDETHLKPPGTYPDAPLTWYQRPLTQSTKQVINCQSKTDTVDGITLASSCTFPAITSGSIICCVLNNVCKSADLVVVVTPTITNPAGDVEKFVNEKETIDLSCSSQDSPTWKWHKCANLSSTICSEEDLWAIIPLETGDSLTLDHVELNEEGLYRCTVYNEAGSEHRIMKLIVRIPPIATLVPAPGTVLKVNHHGEFMLTCQVRAKPIPTIEWYRTSLLPKNLSVFSEYSSPNTFESKLTISDADPKKDSAGYRCKAQSFGHSKYSKVQTVTVICLNGTRGTYCDPCDGTHWGQECSNRCLCNLKRPPPVDGIKFEPYTTCNSTHGHCECAKFTAPDAGIDKPVFAFVGSVCGTATDKYEFALSKVSSSSKAWVAAIIVPILLIVALAVFVRHRNSKKKDIPQIRQSFVGLRRNEDSNVEMTDVHTMEPTLISVNDLAQRVALYSRNEGRQFIDEFKGLDDGSAAYNFTTNVANDPANKPKNRYTNIVPYDHSRVLLSRRSTHEEGEECFDYINANYIDGFESPKMFIACQGPLPNTFDDFWQMVWEHGTTTIVMVTGEVENKRIKCHRYWPDKDHLDYGDVDVYFENEVVLEKYTIRKFRLNHVVQKKERQVIQFQYTAWPDHGVPATTESFLDFRRVVNESRADSENPTASTVVHCSAGVGRTGTFITVDNTLSRAKAQNTVDIAQAVKQMRTSRVNMVQTADQYTFCYTAVLDALTSMHSSSGFPISATGTVKNIPYVPVEHEEALEDEFLELHQFLQGAVQDLTAARNQQNRKKNRYQNVLAVEHSRVKLRDGKSTDYINANFIDGYDRPNAYIAAQAPLSNTVGDFWQMIWEQNSRIIAMGTKLKEASRIKCDKYWPEPGCTKLYGNIEVFNDTQTNFGDFIVRDLVVREVNSSEKRQISHFHFTTWPEHGVPLSTKSTLKYLFHTRERSVQWKTENPEGKAGPIVIHCSAGVGRTGTFCVVDIAINMLEHGQEVDLLKLVAHMRIQRGGMVQTQAQYVFCHQCVVDYIKTK